MLDVIPKLLASDGRRALRAAIADPSLCAFERKVDDLAGSSS